MVKQLERNVYRADASDKAWRVVDSAGRVVVSVSGKMVHQQSIAETCAEALNRNLMPAARA